MYVDSLLSAI